jgi:hypothetical protein
VQPNEDAWYGDALGYVSPPVALDPLRRRLPEIVPYCGSAYKTGCYSRVTRIRSLRHSERRDGRHMAKPQPDLLSLIGLIECDSATACHSNPKRHDSITRSQSARNIAGTRRSRYPFPQLKAHWAADGPAGR